jgi:hypothetical protein
MDELGGLGIFKGVIFGHRMDDLITLVFLCSLMNG